MRIRRYDMNMQPTRILLPPLWIQCFIKSLLLSIIPELLICRICGQERRGQDVLEMFAQCGRAWPQHSNPDVDCTRHLYGVQNKCLSLRQQVRPRHLGPT